MHSCQKSRPSIVDRFTVLAIALLLTLGHLSSGNAQESAALQIERGIAWLEKHYAEQKSGQCEWKPCPLMGQWRLESVKSGGDGLDITFVGLTPVSIEQIKIFQSRNDLPVAMEHTFCPYGGLQIYKIMQESLQIRVHARDPQFGLVASRVCSRRILY